MIDQIDLPAVTQDRGSDPAHPQTPDDGAPVLEPGCLERGSLANAVRTEPVQVEGEQVAFVHASGLDRQRRDDQVVHVVHAVTSDGQLPVAEASASIAVDEGIADVRVAVTERLGQPSLVQLDGFGFPDEHFRRRGQRLNQLALELLVACLTRVVVRGDVIHEPGERTIDVVLDPRQVRAEARGLPVASVQPRQRVEQGSDVRVCDGFQDVRETGTGRDQIIEHQCIAFGLGVVGTPQAERGLDTKLA